jgi:hypothetical protein
VSTSSSPKFNPPLQFILIESELSNIYDAINYKVGTHTTKTQLRLSKPENFLVTIDDVFEDCYLLTLPVGSLRTFLSEIASNDRSRHQSPGIIVSGLERGKKARP